MQLLLASTNLHKLQEFRRLFAGSDVDLVSPSDLGLAPVEVDEDGKTFEENALTKALAYYSAYRIATLADDSGICVDALAGAPGVRSARFGSPDLDDAGRVQYLLESLREVPARRRTAHYVCVLALIREGMEPLVRTGALYGYVEAAPAGGDTGFGYDPILYVPSLGRAVSQLTPAQKDAISHRGRAVYRLVASLQLI